ncbi:hypothetical protein PSTG_01054 [Puccinia striiformis f. sp. tritici PST-78]|uniref:Secreted protein n=1 Tax=Puccinia striiformis f. sp. tritici PST-78 TaxID=1165861 RepID=A0A0L0W2C4_9BASI|nr:hypothetical protein PSTG_01054 [Puccinia striiformis f. sp. tritici PST-78]
MHPARNSYQAMVHILFVGLIITLSISSSHAASGTVQCTTRFLTSGAGGGVPQGLAECGDGKQRRICEIHSCRASSASGRRPLGVRDRRDRQLVPFIWSVLRLQYLVIILVHRCAYFHSGRILSQTDPKRSTPFSEVTYVPEASPPHRVMKYLCPLHQSYYPVCTACRP